MNIFLSKKAITPVVATALLLVVAVGSFAILNGWFQSYQSDFMSSLEIQSNSGYGSLSIEGIFGDKLSIMNKIQDNLSITSIKIGDVECNLTGQNNLSLGITIINVSSCVNSSTSQVSNVVLLTKSKIVDKTVLLHGQVPVYSGCTLDSITVNHGENYTFYNTSVVPFGNVCSSSSLVRVCNDGTYSGDNSYNLSSCSVAGQDTTPNAFSFTNVTGSEFSTIITSNTLTPTGYDGTLSVGIIGDGSPQLSINGGSWITSGQMNLTDNLTIKLTSSSNSLTSNYANLTLGNYSTIWNVTTKYVLNCSSLGLLGGQWVTIKGNSALGTSDFCVMKYEAKFANLIGKTQDTTYLTWHYDNATGNLSIISSPNNEPIAWINQTDARIACANLGTGYHLITDAEWVTIARAAENNPSNWNSSVVGSGFMYSGHNDYDPSNALAADTDDSNGYSGTGNSAPSNQRRTLNISGNMIWDLAGNVWEWDNDTISGNTGGNFGKTSWGWYEWTTISNPLNYGPSNSAFNSTQGMGQLYTGGESDSTVYGFLRGGIFGNGANAGAFTLALYTVPPAKSRGRGFRCSYTG